MPVSDSSTILNSRITCAMQSDKETFFFLLLFFFLPFSRYYQYLVVVFPASSLGQPRPTSSNRDKLSSLSFPRALEIEFVR